MKTTVLVIGVIKKGNSVLLRKKPKGSPPYKETWYVFGGEINGKSQNPEKILAYVLKNQAGINIRPIEHIGWDVEVKQNHRGKKTYYVYVDYLCRYVSGKLIAGNGIERLEWVPIPKLKKYDLVPPSRKLFRRMGYI
jgi:NUDIX domain